MKHHSIIRKYIYLLLAMLLAMPMSAKIVKPVDDLSNPYFEDVATRDSFINCKKPIWTSDWKDLPTDNPNENFADFVDHEKYGNMKFRRLRNRRALTGESCTVNKLINVVGVASWAKNLGAMTDEDLDNYAEINAVVKAGVTVDPMVSIRDMDNYYAKGTVAGFAIVAGSGSSVLSLEIIKALSIGFYRDGHLLGVRPVREGQDGTGLTLKLLQIPGSNDVCAVLTAESEWLFDEISLDCSGGVQANVANLYKVKYAFVGEANEFTITDGGVQKYNSFYDGEKKLDTKINMKGWNAVLLGLPFPFVSSEVKKMTNDDLEDAAAITPILSVGYQGGAKFMMNNATDPKAEAFEAGVEVGYCYTMDALLTLKAGAWVSLLLFDRNGKKVQEETISAQVLGLSLIQAGKGTVSVKSKVPFSGCEIRFLTVLSVDLGGIGIHYGFVKAPADVSHRCLINPTISSNICESQTSFKLRSNEHVSVTWTLVDAWSIGPSPKNILASTNVKVTPDGNVTNLEKGIYTFRATAQDGCYDETTITVGGFLEQDNQCGKPMVNTEGSEPQYDISKIYDTSGALLSISWTENKENILTSSTKTYARYVGGLGLADNLHIIGVRRKQGLMYDANPVRYEGEDDVAYKQRVSPKRVGFVVEASAKVLNLQALQFLQIRCYHEGKEVYRHLIDENNAISADVAGADRVQKIRYSIEIPDKVKNKPMQVDEIQLWKCGVLDLSGSELRIYYAFIEDASADCSSPLACGSLVLSNKNTHTTINADATVFGAGVAVIALDDNLSHLVDDDLDTYMAINNTVTVGTGQTIAVRMGRNLDYHHQLGIVIDNKTFLAAVEVGNWLTVYTYRDGKPTGEKFTDWSVIGAGVAGYGDKNILFFQPKITYDEVRFDVANIVGALKVQKFYGMVVRGDINNNGIPDCKDDCSCVPGVDDIEVNSVCVGDIVNVSATGNTGTKYYLYFGDKHAGTNGVVEIESTSDTYDNIQYSYTTVEPGEYQLSFFDGSGTPLSSVVYKVHPLQTRWLTTATTADWNKWDNWSNGSPYCCTNAIISSDAKIFPVLGTVNQPADYCCKDIFFEPRSAVDNTPSLNYRKAWVELELMPNRYYNLSAPLKQMYTGDMFVPKDASAKYFEPLTEGNCLENRFDPSIYQRLWKATVTGKIVVKNRKGGLVLKDETLGVVDGEWSHNFNAVARPYGYGEGFGLWVDNGSLPEAQPFRIRLPKEHAKYFYYTDYDQEKVSDETLPKKVEDAYRFVYEEDNEDNKTLEYKYKQGGEDITENRTVYVGQSQYTITLKADEPTNTFLMGNPFMSRVNIKKFFEGNSNVGSIRVETPEDEQTITKVGDNIVSTGSLINIEPMQSFYVNTNGDASTEALLVFTPDMIGGVKKAADKGETGKDETGSGEKPKALRVCVESMKTRSKSASLLMLPMSTSDDDVAVVTLMDGEVKPNVKVFGVSNSNAYDIMPLHDVVPLGIYLNGKDSISIELRPAYAMDADEYVLHDNLTGEDYQVGSSVVVANAETSLGRFVIRKRGYADEPSSDLFDGISIMQEGQFVVVRSGADNLKSIEICDIAGRQIDKAQAEASSQLRVKIASGIHIINVETASGKSRSYKMMFN